MRQAYLRTHPKCFYLKNPRFWESRDQPTPGSFPNKDPGYEVDYIVLSYGKPFWTKAVEFFSDGREFSRTVENFLGRSRIFSDGRDFKFSQTIENV